MKGSTRIVTITFDRSAENDGKIAFTDTLAAKSVANIDGNLLATRWVVGD